MKYKRTYSLIGLPILLLLFLVAVPAVYSQLGGFSPYGGGSGATGTGTGDLIHSGTPAAHQFGIFVDDVHIKGVGVTASKPVCTDASAEPTVCTSAPIVGLWASGSCSGYLKSDGTCDAGSGGTPTAITVANEATDTTCFPSFFTDATGDRGPKTNAALTFNSNTGLLSATGIAATTGAFSGAVTGASFTAAKVANTASCVTLYGDDNTTVNSKGFLFCGPIDTNVRASNFNWTVPKAEPAPGEVQVAGTVAGHATTSQWKLPALSPTGYQITFAGPAQASTVTLPNAATMTLARTDAANTFTGVQTMTSPALTTPVVTTDIHAATTNSATVGNAALPFTSIYLGAAATNNIRLTGTSAAARVITLPDIGTDTGATAVLAATSTTTTQALFASSTAGLGTYRAVAAADLPATPLVSGTGATLTGPREYYTCSTTCSVTLPTPAAGYEFCVRNTNNVATVITLADISSVYFELPARTGYTASGKGLHTSAGTVTDQICVVGYDATHYIIMNYSGTWVTN